MTVRAAPRPSGPLRILAIIGGCLLLSALVVLFGVGQLVLPDIAADHVREDLDRDGADVTGVTISAVPAVELIFGHADTVSISARSFTTGPGESNMGKLGQAGTVHLRIAHLAMPWIAMDNVTLTKKPRGSVDFEAVILRSELERRTPPGVEISRRGAPPNVVPITVGGDLLPNHTIEPALKLDARKGVVKLVLDAAGIPFSPSLISITVFSDPDFHAERATLTAVPEGWRLSMIGRLV